MPSKANCPPLVFDQVGDDCKVALFPFPLKSVHVVPEPEYEADFPARRSSINPDEGTAAVTGKFKRPKFAVNTENAIKNLKAFCTKKAYLEPVLLPTKIFNGVEVLAPYAGPVGVATTVIGMAPRVDGFQVQVAE